MERALHPKGERFDCDKERAEMNEEGKLIWAKLKKFDLNLFGYFFTLNLIFFLM